MRYVQIENLGPNNSLIISTQPIPAIKESQILVHVKATALNRADLMQRRGVYPPPIGESDIPGLEVAGDVVAIGSEVKQFEIGDQVYALVGSGGYAEFCPVEASLAHCIPKSWNYSQAAALPEALTTVYATLYDLGKLKADQTLLIHGAGSGISSLAIQMATHTKARVITTVGDSSKMDKAIALGAAQVINYKEHDFEDLIEEQSVDLVIDYIGGDYFNKHLHLLKPKGKLIQLSCINGSTVECSLALLMRKRLQVNGFVLRSQSIIEKAKLWKSAHKDWYDLLSSKQIMPIIDSQYPLEDIEQAHHYFQSSKHFGKIVVEVG